MSDYQATAVTESGGLTDVRIKTDGKTWHMWGRNSQDRELALIRDMDPDSLPVFIGSGLGLALNELAQHPGPVAVVDRESGILNLTKVRDKLKSRKNILWIDAETLDEAIRQLSAWQLENQGKSFQIISIPLYLRLDQEYYKAIKMRLESAAKIDFFQAAARPRFQNAKPKVLLLKADYYLYPEIITVLKRMDIECLGLDISPNHMLEPDFIKNLLESVVSFKPDLALTVNHIGIDHKGVLTGLLRKMKLPLASWFVDSPSLIIHKHQEVVDPNTVIFSWDTGLAREMKKLGFKHVFYLPLGTDAQNFKPGGLKNIPRLWHSDVSFVGHSMWEQVGKHRRDLNLSAGMEDTLMASARNFIHSPEQSVPRFMKHNSPELYAFYQRLNDQSKQLLLEGLITWEATKWFRHGCVEKLLPFAPIIAGDKGWKQTYPPGLWRYVPSLDYYKELPAFYQCSKINFNCTSAQMKGAVNQRVFDVPACGGFVFTDYRPCLRDLFDPDEVAYFKSMDEIPDKIKFYLENHELRKSISRKARKRILAQHTYEHRLAELLDKVRGTSSLF